MSSHTERTQWQPRAYLAMIKTLEENLELTIPAPARLTDLLLDL